ncbi:hypothetical protein ACIQ9P_38300 [Kitasatospora sp. NPDC094019]|uniref:hypothetical protein n=1 Tax=Kitasatospora sp. NPDC094019 TaxID=3364091 RepID=UPI003826F6D4
MSLTDPLAHATRLRAHYTGEAYPACRVRLGPQPHGVRLIPDAESEQQRLEHHLLTAIARPFRWTRLPFGISHLEPARALTLHLDDSAERVRDILSWTLPWANPDDSDGEVHGIAGLRLSDWRHGRVSLTVPDTDAKVVLAGLTAATWNTALRAYHANLAEIPHARLYWQSDPTAVTAHEADFTARWEHDDDHCGWWLASGLLRRMPLFASWSQQAHALAA